MNESLEGWRHQQQEHEEPKSPTNPRAWTEDLNLSRRTRSTQCDLRPTHVGEITTLQESSQSLQVPVEKGYFATWCWGCRWVKVWNWAREWPRQFVEPSFVVGTGYSRKCAFDLFLQVSANNFATNHICFSCVFLLFKITEYHHTSLIDDIALGVRLWPKVECYCSSVAPALPVLHMHRSP